MYFDAGDVGAGFKIRDDKLLEIKSCTKRKGLVRTTAVLACRLASSRRARARATALACVAAADVVVAACLPRATCG